MNKLTLYVREAYSELINKVTWPSWQELQESAMVVLIASLIFALIVLAMDLGSRNLMEVIYQAIIGR